MTTKVYGDSVWFKPNDESHFSELDGRAVEYNKGGFAQLRLEGIDALELHYQDGLQLEAPAVAARDRLLQLIGFDLDSITYAPASDPEKPDTSIRTAEPHPIDGYIYTRSTDPYGRPIAFAYAGNTRPRKRA